MVLSVCSKVEAVLFDIELALDAMVARDERLEPLADDVREHLLAVVQAVKSASDRPLDAADADLVLEAGNGLNQMVVQIQLMSVPDDRSVGVAHAEELIERHRRHIRTLEEVLLSSDRFL